MCGERVLGKVKLGRKECFISTVNAREKIKDSPVLYSMAPQVPQSFRSSQVSHSEFCPFCVAISYILLADQFPVWYMYTGEIQKPEIHLLPGYITARIL